MTKIYTIGFAGKNAEHFFTLLQHSDIKLLVDIRLNNTSQLSAYAKKQDLEYFLHKICNIDYVHLELFAPTKEILDSYKKKKITWDQYEDDYLKLIERRKVKNSLKNFDFDGACLLCSEPTPEHCHRRLAAEFIRDNFDIQRIVHL